MSEQMNQNGYELGWDDAIENDGPEYVTLPEGDYDFTVIDFSRERYSPKEGGKLPPCNMAVVNIRLEGAEGTTTVKHNLYLHSTTEGLLCAFFTAIGLRKHGERATMNWSAVPGARGRAKVGVRRYKGKDGDDRTINEIKKFYEPEGQNTAPAGVPPTQTTYQPGRF